MSKGVEAIDEPIMVIKDICPEHVKINSTIPFEIYGYHSA